MKLLLTLLFCSSLISFSQKIELNIRVIDANNGKHLKNAKITLGNEAVFGHAYGGQYTARYFEGLNPNNLADTLFVQLSDYSFEEKPLIEHDYFISTNNGVIEYVGLTLYGVPHVRNYALELPIAKSKKSNIDSVALQIYLEKFKEERSIRLMNLKGEKIVEIEQNWVGKNHIEQYVKFLDLEDGYFEMEANGIIKRYPFNEMDYLSPIYLGNSFTDRKRELEAVSALIENRKALLVQQEELKWRHEVEIDQYERTIDSLETEIYILKNGPSVGVPPGVLNEVVEREEEVVYMFVKDELAQPAIGQDAFLKGLSTALIEHKVKKSGIVEVKITIDKAGRSNFIVSQYEEHITAAITEYMNGIAWIPSQINGRPENAHLNLFLYFYKE